MLTQIFKSDSYACVSLILGSGKYRDLFGEVKIPYTHTPLGDIDEANCHSTDIRNSYVRVASFIRLVSIFLFGPMFFLFQGHLCIYS